MALQVLVELAEHSHPLILTLTLTLPLCHSQRQHLHMLPRGYQFLIVNLAVKTMFVVLINQIEGGVGVKGSVGATRCWP